MKKNTTENLAGKDHLDIVLKPNVPHISASEVIQTSEVNSSQPREAIVTSLPEQSQVSRVAVVNQK